jgi:PAS domain S-box-containing protein
LAPSDKKIVIRVLHVDDELCLLEVSKQILTMENSFEVDNAPSVDEALKKMGEQQYDAIVSDYEMPQKNGLEFLKELRSKNNQIPFILFTGKGREDVAVKALNLGADSYINKNGSPDTVYGELADAINKTVERKKSREMLAKSELKYHKLVENSLQGISILQPDPIKIVFANGAFGKILGYSPEELTSLSPEEIISLIYHEDRVCFFKRMENRLRGEPAGACYEFRAVRKDGSLIWLSSLANRVDFDGQPAVQGMFLDINESKKAEEILRESEQKYRELANCLPDIVFETDLNGRLEFANERAAEISGYSLDEVERELNIFQFIVPEERDRAIKNIQRLLSGGSYVPSEYKFIRKDGTTFPALITATPRVCKNKVSGFRGIVLDISERKAAEEKVRFEAERLERVMENSKDLIMLTKPDGSVVYVNSALRKITGYSKTEFVGKNLWIVHPEDSGLAKEVFGRILKGENVEFEHRIVTKDGQTKWVIHSCLPIIREEIVTELVSTIRDITEFKKNQGLLRRKEQELEDILDSSPTIVFYKDLNGKFILTNETFAQTLNTTKDNLLGKTVFDIYSNKIAQDMTDDDNSVLISKIPKLNIVEQYESPVGLRWIRTHKIPKFDENGEVTGLIGFSEEITDYKKAEAELKESLNDYQSLINGMSETAWVIDFEGNFLEVNDAALNVLGYSKDELLCIGIKGIDKHLSRVQDQELMDNLRSYKKQIFETIHTTRDGVEISVEISSSLITYQGKQSILSIARNITERKIAEDKLKQTAKDYQLLNEKLRVIGGLTRHDVGNKLSVIWGNEFLLRKRLGNQPELTKCLDNIKTAIETSNKLLEFSHFYEKIGVEKPSKTDVAECFNQAVALHRNLEAVTVINECRGLEVMADSLLKQLFYNLIDNSLKHGEKVNEIRLYYVEEADRVKLFYEDNGVGIPEVNKEKVFQEGFSTGKTTGLGLFLINKMVEVYGWTIIEKGKPGKGAKFVITIPMTVFENQQPLENRNSN